MTLYPVGAPCVAESIPKRDNCLGFAGPQKGLSIMGRLGLMFSEHGVLFEHDSSENCR